MIELVVVVVSLCLVLDNLNCYEGPPPLLICYCLFLAGNGTPGLATVLECFITLAAENFGAKLVNFCYYYVVVLIPPFLADFTWRI